MKYYRSSTIMGAMLIASLKDSHEGGTPQTFAIPEEGDPLKVSPHVAGQFKPDICNLLVIYENGSMQFMSPAVLDVWEEVDEPQPAAEDIGEEEPEPAPPFNPAASTEDSDTQTAPTTQSMGLALRTAGEDPAITLQLEGNDAELIEHAAIHGDEGLNASHTDRVKVLFDMLNTPVPADPDPND